MNNITSPLSDPDSLFDAFNTALSNSLDFYAPSTTLTHRNNPKSPWFNTELTNMRKALRRLQSIYASSKMNSDLCSLKYVAHYTGKNSYPLNHHTLLTCFVNMVPPLSKPTTYHSP